MKVLSTFHSGYAALRPATAGPFATTSVEFFNVMM